MKRKMLHLCLGIGMIGARRYKLGYGLRGPLHSLESRLYKGWLSNYQPQLGFFSDSSSGQCDSSSD
ncbi:ECU05_0115 [Encephalitozoon cuniculi GB-M1]|uniref:ECU05_0115 protein n=1 Tax=Encephalitozoon cuniculi (strain GB-M1) TaxID=284813 RepID=A0A1T5PD68_ENCCU|nr:uncharacterized protein ECU05_0115 [Encephalitozoon cuniculi GB-M1]UYI27798.1 hypothetical protein J0A71_08g16850 [Encephalitozoon cuniculi]SKD10697.1 ECU05_0115 [Encephalitozoon cuniculi GB-M1]